MLTMCFRELLESILDLIKSIFTKDKKYQSLKDIPETKNKEAIELFRKIIKEQGIAEFQIKHGRKIISSYSHFSVNWHEEKGLDIKTKNISVEGLAQSVKKNLEETQRSIDKNITETKNKIDRLDELIAILEEYNNK
ncbi:hypothetical protein cce_3567 [Crocosphaera subtropica ATCC 51142]|uniref:Uncharacterized protein n=2 Tax=Crocosphaera TaxID=263510 RepID=B1X016_CROS5|nr:hypothetical protein cce_3567 [Crocosphaera subtropica ATCC 51142]